MFNDIIFKKGLSFLLIFTFSVILISCSKLLDKTPETSLTDASFWKSPSDLISACNALYASLPSIADGYKDNYSDIAYATASNEVSDGSRLAPATSGDWSNNYSLIRKANTIIEKSVSVSGDTSIINQAIAEARFFRAWGYFELLKRYGDVPLILRTFDIDDTLNHASRTPRADVIKQIYADLDFAAGVLPDADAQAGKDYGRITSGAAMAFESRVALFEGTREKFFGYGDSKADLKIAINAALTVMNSGKYDLYTYTPKPDSSYYYLFQYEGEGRPNKENILVRLYGENMTNSISSTNVAGDEDKALITPTKALMDLYLYKDGLPKDKSAFYKPQISTITEFENRDPRAGITIFNKNLWYLSTNYVPNFSFTVTGYKYAKWFNAMDRPIYSFIDFAIIRYAEVLLNFAEATFELDESINDEDLNKSINQLRKRAGSDMTPLTNAFVATHGLDMRMEIRRERTVELAEEGFRYWDLLRWKTAEIELPKAIIGAKYFPEEQGELQDPNLTSDGFIIVQPASKRSFKANRDYLWPIPTTEFGYDPNLKPNPNW